MTTTTTTTSQTLQRTMRVAGAALYWQPPMNEIGSSCARAAEFHQPIRVSDGLRSAEPREGRKPASSENKPVGVFTRRSPRAHKQILVPLRAVCARRTGARRPRRRSAARVSKQVHSAGSSMSQPGSQPATSQPGRLYGRSLRLAHRRARPQRDPAGCLTKQSGSER